MSVLTADDLAETHPELPPDWRKSMAQIRWMGGPWECTNCDGPSYLCYRCSKCGTNLAGE